MAINGKTKAVVDALLTSDTTTETQFKTGLTDVTAQLETINTNIDNIQASFANGLTLGDWSFTPNNTNLYVSYQGTNVGVIDASGNFKVIGNVTAYGTI